MFYYMDPTYILVIIGIIITMVASAKMNSAYSKYAKIRSTCGMTGGEVARKILQANGIYGVTVQKMAGSLTDNYNPTNKTVNLSEDILNSYSIAAVSVAAHECGHAIQDNKGYFPLGFRSAFFPIASIGSRLAWPMLLIGLLLSYGASYSKSNSISYYLIQIGIILFLMTVIFQIITLPVEFNASKRALNQLKTLGILPDDEEDGAHKVLVAAALTYVAAAASSLLQLLRIIILFGGRRNRD